MKVLRKIRERMLNQNQTKKYLFYAIGEIILVVIGILIALQINNWNTQRQLRQQEVAYLHEIINNLERDSIAISENLDFNVRKIEILQNLLSIFSINVSNEERVEIFWNNSDGFVYYRIFNPVKTAYDNMLSAQSIELIKDPVIRRSLSEYYDYNYNGGIQERMVNLNREIVDSAFPEFITKESIMEQMDMNMPVDIISTSDLQIHKDRHFLSNLYGLRYLVNLQSEFLVEMTQKNQTLRNAIELYIEK